MLKAKDPLHTPVTGDPGGVTRDIAIPKPNHTHVMFSTTRWRCAAINVTMGIRRRSGFQGGGPCPVRR